MYLSIIEKDDRAGETSQYRQRPSNCQMAEKTPHVVTQTVKLLAVPYELEGMESGRRMLRTAPASIPA